MSPCGADLKMVVSMSTASLSLSLSSCLGSMPGTLACSSLRSRQAYWAAPSATRCDAWSPSPSTPLSPLRFPCRGLTRSTWSTSTCDIAARRCLTRAGRSGLPGRRPPGPVDPLEQSSRRPAVWTPGWPASLRGGRWSTE